METNNNINNNTRKNGLVIPSFALACISLILSFLPLIGAAVIPLYFLSILLCGIAYYLSKKENQITSLPLYGIIFSLIALSLGFFQRNNIKEGIEKLNNDMEQFEKEFKL